jgi:bifunctional DNase/RNase
MSMAKKSSAPAIALILLAFSSVMAYAIMNIMGQDMNDFVEVNYLKVSGTTILIGNNCTAIVAETTDERAESIANGANGIINERPDTQDTLAAVLKSFNITLDSASIDRYDGNYYYAYIVLNSGDKVLKLDTRPSDAIALAVRTNSTIYVNKTMLKEIGQNIC